MKALCGDLVYRKALTREEVIPKGSFPSGLLKTLVRYGNP